MKVTFPEPKYRSLIVIMFILLEGIFLIYNVINPKFDQTFNRAVSQAIQIIFCIWVLTSRFDLKMIEIPRVEEETIKKFQSIRNAIPILRDKTDYVIRGILENAENHIREFINLLFFVWGTWLIFFMVTLAKTLNYLKNDDFGEVIEVLTNCIPCVIFYLCYKKLNNPEIKSMQEIRPAIAYVALFSALHTLLLVIFKDYQNQINIICLLLSGLFNAVFIAILAGRLESKNINPPTVYIWVMYFYAALQPLVFLTKLNYPYEWITITANVRLWLLAIGKSLFYLFMLRIVDSKRLVYYFVITPYLEEESDEFDKYKNEL